MKRLLFALTFFGIVNAGNACSCTDDSLNKTCPNIDQLGKQCLSYSNGTWVMFDSEPRWNIGENSSCRMGKTTCNAATKKVSCVGTVLSQPEICGDQIDNDCDFEVDEGFDRDGDGFKTCDNDCNDGNPDINPLADEICDNLDNNCDGKVDSFSTDCWSGNPNAILDDSTTCKKGTDFCVEGEWSGCIGQVLDEQEQCDRIDNDCDGIVDNNVVTDGANCGPINQVGACKYGVETCVNGESYCIDTTTPTEEVCDGVDNNCNHEIDEDLIQLCFTVCGQGYEYCSLGEWVSCSAPQPTAEVCDGLDNNCDGEVDEGCECINGTAQSCLNDMIDNEGNATVCGIGAQICQNGQWGQCIFSGTLNEECNNWDDDCDGIIDGMILTCGDPTFAGIGSCRLGESTCTEGEWTECEGDIEPTKEVCDSRDNNCNGEIDEGLDPNDKVDMVFVVDISGSMCPKIEALHEGILNYVANFEGTEHLFGLVVFPTTTEPNLNHVAVVTTPELTDVASFATALDQLGCSGPGIEPSYDAMQMITSSSDPLNIGWRNDATPYVILITDEPGQSLLDNSEGSVALQTNICEIGNCMGGDFVEVSVITTTDSSYSYDAITYYDPNRIYNILPSSGFRYTDILRSIFENICIY